MSHSYDVVHYVRGGLINDYLHVEINQYGNCAKPVPISSGFFYSGLLRDGSLCYDKLHFPMHCCQTAMEIDLGKHSVIYLVSVPTISSIDLSELRTRRAFERVAAPM